jgi:sugar phosphate permease
MNEKELKSAEVRQKISKKQICLLIGIVCIGTYIANYYLRNILSVSAPDLILSKEFTETSIGLFSSTYMLFYAAGQLVNGFLGDILSPKWMIFTGMTLGGCSVIVFPFLPNDALRIVCFAVLGFGLSMVRGPLMKIISESTEPRQARLICVFFSVASFTGPLIASLFVLMLPVRYAFIVSGIVAVLIVSIATVVFGFMQKKQLITFRPIKAKSFSSIFDAFRIENFGYYLVVACLVEISGAAISFWIPTYLSTYLNFDSEISNLIYSAISICRSCMPFISLLIFNATGERTLPLMRIGFALSAFFFLLMQAFTSPVLNVLLMILALMSMSLTSAMLWSIYIPGLGKTGRASSVNGVLDCAGYIAAALANLVFGAVSAMKNWNIVLLLWASIGIVGVVATFFAKKEKQQ